MVYCRPQGINGWLLAIRSLSLVFQVHLHDIDDGKETVEEKSRLDALRSAFVNDTSTDTMTSCIVAHQEGDFHSLL